MNTQESLNEQSKAIYDHLANVIDIDDANQMSVAILADLIGRYRDCQADIDENGLVLVSSTGNVRANPVTTYQAKIIPQIRSLFLELNIYKRDDAIDPLKEFMND